MFYKYLPDVHWILCNRMKYPADIQWIFIGHLYVIIIFYIFIIFTLLSYSCMQIKHIFNNTTKYPINFLGYPGHIQNNPEDVLCCLGTVFGTRKNFFK